MEQQMCKSVYFELRKLKVYIYIYKVNKILFLFI